jgi:hypothetical protein
VVTKSLPKSPVKKLRFRQKFFAFLFPILGFSLLSLFVTLPAVFNLSTKFISDGGDLYLFAMDQVHQRFTEGGYPFGETTALRYPIGYNFGIGVDAMLGVLTGASLLSFFSPVASYNLTLLFLLTCNGLASYMFFRHVTNSSKLGAIGAVAYGYSFYVLARGAGHLNLFFTAGFPLVALGTLKLAKPNPKWTDVAIFYLGTLLLSWGSLQYAIMGVILALVALLFGILFYRPQVKTLFQNSFKLWHAHALFGSLAMILFLWTFWPTVFGILSGSFIARDKGSVAELDIEFRHLLLPDASYTPTLFAKLLPHDEKPNIEHAMFLGIFEVIAFFFFFVSNRSLKEKGFIACLCAVFLIFALGTTEAGIPMPYAILVKHFPFSAIAEPGRYSVVILLFMTIGIVRGLQSIHKKNLATVTASGLLILLLLERIPSGYFQADAHQGPYVDLIRQQTGQAVMNVPVNFARQEYSLTPIYTEKSVIDGYIHWSTDTAESRAFITEENGDIKRFLCSAEDPVFENLKSPEDVAKLQQSENQKNRAMLEKLKQNNIRTLVVHKDADFFHPHCANVRARLNFLVPRGTTAVESSTTTQWLDPVYNGQVGTSIYFPKDGIFALHGVATSVPDTTLFARLGDQPVSLPDTIRSITPGGLVYTTTDGNGKVYDEFRYFVPAGTTFTITSDAIRDLASTTIWYDYQTAPNSTEVKPARSLERLYADEKLEIFAIP